MSERTQGQRAVIGDYLRRDLQAAISDGERSGGKVNVSRLRRILNHALAIADRVPQRAAP